MTVTSDRSLSVKPRGRKKREKKELYVPRS